MKRITVWTEYHNDAKESEKYATQIYGKGGYGELIKAYPEGMGFALADIFKGDKDCTVTVTSVYEKNDGLSEELLSNTDVLIYWAHLMHDKVQDETVERIVRHVNTGMGVILLHSAHHSKLFKRLCGTTCDLTWREAGEYERIWTAAPYHPIAAGVENGFVIPHEEMYGEPFDIPEPETTVFLGWFEGGEVFRSGVTYTRGYGKVFYFQPGHETFPVYKQKEIIRILRNAVNWALPAAHRTETGCPNRKEFLKR